MVVGIGSVTYGGHSIARSVWQKREVDSYVSRIPVGGSAEIVTFTGSAHGDDVFSQLSVYNSGLVEYYRQRGDKTDTFLFSTVVGRRVTKHGERRVMDYVAG